MIITINNLGPIQQANFDFDKKLSVFCGPNNTGKTYLSYVLYAFTRQRIFAFEESLTDAQLNDFFVKRSLLLTINFESIYEAMSKRRFSMPGDMATIFGISETNAEKLFADFEMHISVDKDVYVANLKEREIDVTISTKGQSLAQVTKKTGENVLLVQNISSSLDIDREAIKDELLNQIYKILSFPVFFSHFFPVERIGLYTYYKDIMANRSQLMGLLQRLENDNRQALLDYISRNSSRYPVAVSYTLDAANKMSVLSQERGYYANLADDIEEDILGGKLTLTDEGDLRYTSKKVPDKDIPLYLTASMTKSISGIVYALRHVVGRYDMIFIDEPEVNCHPNAQILMARIFGKMVNAGLRIVVSTHSDYIIRELNNLIMAEALQRKVKDIKIDDEYGYSKDELLNVSDVGAYSFNPDHEGRVKVVELEVNDYGFDVKSINAAIEAQNSITNDLYDRLTYEVLDDGDK